MKIYLASQCGKENYYTSSGIALALQWKGSLLPPEVPIRLLLSYFYSRAFDMNNDTETLRAVRQLGIFADSGAYSAFTRGTPVLADDYIAWVKRWEPLFDCAAGPDVIGDAASTADATNTMLQEIKGIPVLPAFHVGEDWSWLDYWVKRVDYLALGGMVPHMTHQRFMRAWLTKAFERIPSTCRVHGFGLTAWHFVKEFPFYSVDSSSWTAFWRFGDLSLFDEERGGWSSMHPTADGRGVFKHFALLAKYGLEPSQLRRGRDNYFPLVNAQLMSWHNAEAWADRYKLKLKSRVEEVG